MPYATAAARREYVRKWVKARRDDWIASRGGVCERCGSTDRLEVDHRDPSEKLMNPRDIWSRTETVRFAELAKCQVLCRGCHSAKTSAENFASVHGTHQMYNKHKCRCDQCKAAHAALAREYRAAGKAW